MDAQLLETVTRQFDIIKANQTDHPTLDEYLAIAKELDGLGNTVKWAVVSPGLFLSMHDGCYDLDNVRFVYEQVKRPVPKWIVDLDLWSYGVMVATLKTSDYTPPG